jgi:hypothetical protein
MPSPREQALSIGTDASQFREAGETGAGAHVVPEPKEPDYRANPKNPPDGEPQAKITNKGG